MNRLVSRLWPVPLFLAIWIILNGALNWSLILLGLAVSVVALAITNATLLGSDYASVYRLRPSILLRYAIMVFGQIYQSGILAIPRILSGRGEVAIDAYPSSLEAELPLAMLSTAVTLTPGTVTVALSGRTLHILHFRETRAPDALEKNSWKPVAIESILAGKRP